MLLPDALYRTIAEHKNIPQTLCTLYGVCNIIEIIAVKGGFVIKSLMLSIVFLVLLAGCNSATIPSTAELDEPPSQNISTPSLDKPPSNEESPYLDYEKYISPFKYPLGGSSWDSYEDIQPDALAVFYISLSSIGERETITSGPTDDVYGNFLMPADDVAQRVQKYFAFEIPREHIEKSEYYDPEKDAYWTGGIGSTAYIEITNVEQQNDVTIITYTERFAGSSRWTGNVTLRIADNGFQYISFEREEAAEPPSAASTPKQK